MLNGAPRLRPPSLELILAAAYQPGFRRRQRVVAVGNARRPSQHAVLLLTERHKIPGLKLQGLNHLSRDRHLAAQSNAASLLLGCGRLLHARPTEAEARNSRHL